ncbi:MAG: extracellular solute-binding protein [Victivallaceae bacterium]|jgi:ABC-type Fe3+ transport system substrate-binding protein|nr:extracellular solute-binding protein [Victivallaceae bacterium]
MMLKHLMIAFIPLALLLVLPFSLRPVSKFEKVAAAEKIVIVSPHSETIRYEFEKAFCEYYQQKTGSAIGIEWRSIGGTSDIIRYVNDRYEASFREWWQQQDELEQWNGEIAQSFKSPGILNDPSASESAKKARRIFLDSETGIGIDLMFGGGQYDHHRQAERGFAVDAGLLKLQREWFTPEIIPQQFSGEIFYDTEGRYYGTCLAAFGICYNKDRIAELGLEAPRRWDDLADPRYFQNIALADPTKAGSITKCFEMLIQDQMQRVEDDHEQGWRNGMNLIKIISANARYFTDSASKVTKDTASGNAAAGMCIDFYGRSEAEWSGICNEGVERIVFSAPRGGTSLSADPIHLLRGAPHRQGAIEFIKFVLSEDGQKLWNYRVGTPGGPVKYALRRMPIRRDMFTREHQQYMADAATNPYNDASGFDYKAELTGRYFNLIRICVKCFALDPLPELRAAWQAILEAGGPEKVPAAMAEFNRLPFEYRELARIQRELSGGKRENILAMLKQQRLWSEACREQYRRVEMLARKHTVSKRDVLSAE